MQLQKVFVRVSRYPRGNECPRKLEDTSLFGPDRKRERRYRSWHHLCMLVCDLNNKSNPVPYTDILSYSRRNVNAIRVLMSHVFRFWISFAPIYVMLHNPSLLKKEKKRIYKNVCLLEKVNPRLHALSLFFIF